jgi:trehalose-6-phosphate synthase
MARTISAFYPCASKVITMLFAMAIGSNNNNHTDYKEFANSILRPTLHKISQKFYQYLM